MRRILAIPTCGGSLLPCDRQFRSLRDGTFLPTMLIRYHGLSIGRAGLIAASFSAQPLVGLTAGGWLADTCTKVLRGRLLLALAACWSPHPCSTSDLRSRPVRRCRTILLSLGWLLYFTTTAAFIPLADVVEPRLRATAMASTSSSSTSSERVFAPLSPARCRYVRKAGDGRGGTSQMTDAFRAIGLQSAMAWWCVGDCLDLRFAVLAARSLYRDARKTASPDNAWADSRLRPDYSRLPWKWRDPVGDIAVEPADRS